MKNVNLRLNLDRMSVAFSRELFILTRERSKERKDNKKQKKTKLTLSLELLETLKDDFGVRDDDVTEEGSSPRFETVFESALLLLLKALLLPGLLLLLFFSSE